jgi:hypothetical protein
MEGAAQLCSRVARISYSRNSVDSVGNQLFSISWGWITAKKAFITTHHIQSQIGPKAFSFGCFLAFLCHQSLTSSG